MVKPPSASDPRRHPAVQWSRLKTRWPFLVWLVAAGLVGVLVYSQGGSRVLSGVIEKQVTEVGALETALIKDVLVESGQLVRQGDVLAVLDTVLVDAEMAAAETAQKLTSRRVMRQFENARFQGETDLNALRIDNASATAELEVLTIELERMEKLLERRLIDSQLVGSLRVRKNTLQAAVERYPAAIQQLEEYVQWAKNEKAALLKDLADESTQALALRKGQYRLVALHDGVVSQVLRHPGEVVDVRETVLTLVRQRSRRVIALLPEDRAAAVSVGQLYTIQSRISPRSRQVPAKVVALSPEIIGMPQQSVLVPGRVIRGRQVFLEILEDHPFLPGEAVQVRSPRAIKKREPVAQPSRPDER